MSDINIKRVSTGMNLSSSLRCEILCAKINIKLARGFTHVLPSERLVEIELRTEVLNELLEQVPRAVEKPV